MPKCASNLQDAESRNTAVPSSKELAAQNHFLRLRRRGRTPAALNREQKKPGRSGNSQQLPSRRPRKHRKIFARQTARELPSLHRILIQMSPLLTLHPMLTKAHRR